VCLRKMQLHGDFPIRHGFKAIGVRQGQHSGWHTGPCEGTRFPNLSISTEGTRWGLAQARKFLVQIQDVLAKLATNPDIIWHPSIYNRRTGRFDLDLAHPEHVKYGDEGGLDARGRPSYASLHRKRKAEAEARERELVKAVDEYERVLATWSPDKYPVTGAAKKVETVHMATPRHNSRGETWVGILCKRFARFTRTPLLKTDDPAKVTCKRCRTMLGLPPAS